MTLEELNAKYEQPCDYVVFERPGVYMMQKMNNLIRDLARKVVTAKDDAVKDAFRRGCRVCGEPTHPEAIVIIDQGPCIFAVMCIRCFDAN